MRRHCPSRYDSRDSYLVHLVYAGRVWRAQHESGVYWSVDGRVWIYELRLSICRIPGRGQALRPAACLYREHPLFFPDLHHVSHRELGITSFQWRREPGGGTAHGAAALGSVFLYHGIW